MKKLCCVVFTLMMTPLIALSVLGDEEVLKPEPTEVSISEPEADKVENFYLKIQLIQTQYAYYITQLAQKYKLPLLEWQFDEANRKFIKVEKGE